MSKPTPLELYYEAHPGFVSRYTFKAFTELLARHGYAIVLTAEQPKKGKKK